MTRVPSSCSEESKLCYRAGRVALQTGSFDPPSLKLDYSKKCVRLCCVALVDAGNCSADLHPELICILNG